MKLIELLETINQGQEDSTTRLSWNGIIENTITPQVLEQIKDKLLLLDEFATVKKINIIKMPQYFADENDVPLQDSKTFVGGKMKSSEVSTYQFKDGEIPDFEEVIDLYTISLSEPVYDKVDINKLDYGVWLLPTELNFSSSSNLSSSQMIVIKWSPCDTQDLSMHIGTDMSKKVKENILSKISELIDSKTPNVPFEKFIRIRMSKRSIKTTKRELTN